MDLYVQIRGGLGKNFSFLRVTRHLKKYYERIFVLTPYWDIFACSEDIDGVYQERDIRDFILDSTKSKSYLVLDKMYELDGFIKKEINYSEAWCILCNVPKCKPSKTIELSKIFQVFPEHNQNLQIIRDVMSKYDDFVIMQFNGGQTPLMVNGLDPSNRLYNPFDESLKRNYPHNYAQKFVDLFRKKYPRTGIIHYSLPNEPRLEGTELFSFPYLTYFLLSKQEGYRGFVSIDSSLQHMLSGEGKGNVIWGHTLPKSFGYSFNNNIIQECDRSNVFYFTELGSCGTRVEYIKPKELLDRIVL